MYLETHTDAYICMTYTYLTYEREIERKREIYYKDWFVQLWSLRSPNSCCMQAGDPESVVYIPVQVHSAESRGS